MKETYNIGKCANCGSENIDYHAAEPVEDLMCYPYHCNDCNTDGNEWYNMQYSMTTTQE